MCDTRMHLVATVTWYGISELDYNELFWEQDGGGREGRKEKGKVWYES